MKNKIIGISTVSSILLLFLVFLLILISGEFFSAQNIQLLIVLFTLSVVLTGMYLMASHCPKIKIRNELLITGLGLVLIVFSAIVAFNVLDIVQYFNWLISGGIVYVLLIQLQIFGWGRNISIVKKILSVFLIVSNVSLIVYFIAKWHYSGISIWINIAVLISVLSFLIGVITTKKIVTQEEVSSTK